MPFYLVNVRHTVIEQYLVEADNMFEAGEVESYSAGERLGETHDMDNELVEVSDSYETKNEALESNDVLYDYKIRFEESEDAK